jgi:hypothetical protein
MRVGFAPGILNNEDGFEISGTSWSGYFDSLTSPTVSFLLQISSGNDGGFCHDTGVTKSVSNSDISSINLGNAPITTKPAWGIVKNGGANLAAFEVYAFLTRPASIAAALAGTPYFLSIGAGGTWSQLVSDATPSMVYFLIYDENTDGIYVSNAAQNLKGATLNIQTMTELH